MLDDLLIQEQSSDLLSTAYDFLNKSFIGDISWRTWMDVAGLGVGFVSGFKKNPLGGLIGYGIAAFPEFWDWTYRLTQRPGSTFQEDTFPFLTDAGADLLFMGFTYFGGQLLRGYYENKHPEHYSRE